MRTWTLPEYIITSFCYDSMLTNKPWQVEQLSRGKLSREQVIQLASANMLELLDVDVVPEDVDLVAFEGGSIFDLEGKPKAVLSSGKQMTEIF
jgi:hypothetical protein